MLSMLLMLSCGGTGNNPPRFQTINGREVKYILGFAYLSNPGEIFTAEAGETVTIDIEVTDINGDEIELLFPRSPKGWEFESTEKSGVWHVPEDPLDYFYALQALAIDEHGASDILYFDYGIAGFWDSGLWDTAFDFGDILGDVQYLLKGNGNVESGFEGTLTLEAQTSFCSVRWEFPQPYGIEVQPCPGCVRAWKIRPNQGILGESDCQEIFEAYGLDFSPDQLRSLVELPEEIAIGWTPSFLWNDIQYENAILYQADAQWLPYGVGSIQANRLDFSLNID